jgi:hypothetical protein
VIDNISAINRINRPMVNGFMAADAVKVVAVIIKIIIDNIIL